MTSQPPSIRAVRRSFVEARGGRFHVTEAGPPDGRPVLALHGWPQHHWVYRDLLADPPAGMRMIAPDLPGCGWSGPAPHNWAKEDVVSDVVALTDALGLQRVLLVGHDWGGYVGHLLTLRAPERIEGYLALNIAHPWVSWTAMARHTWRFLMYQPLIAIAGVPVQQRTGCLDRAYRRFSEVDAQTAPVHTERFRDPVVARTARDTYRTFLFRETPRLARSGERRQATVPIRVLFGRNDAAIAPALAAPETARADDYTLELIDGGHFIVDERPDLVRNKLIRLAAEVPAG